METADTLPPTPGARLQAVLCTAAFVLLLAGTNATTPLLPVYRDALGFSSLTVTLTFFVYVGALVAVLFLAARPAIARRAPLMLLAAVAIALAGDLLLATGSVSGVLAGRALAGISGGVGTGAASALVVAAIGARGRAVSATGNLAGAVLGTAASELVLQLTGTGAVATCFHLHAAACAALALPLAASLVARRAVNRRLIRTAPVECTDMRPILRRHRGALLSGALAWIAISACIVFLPTYFLDHRLPVVQALGIPALLLASLAAQLASPALARRLPGLSGMLPMALGIALILAAARSGSTPAGVAGFVLVGGGAGFAYRCALLRLTGATSPAAQGRLASLYAAITYSVAAIAVLLAGMLAQVAGAGPVTTGLMIALAITAFLVRPVAARAGPAGHG